MKSVDNKATCARIDELAKKINAAAEEITNVTEDINGKIADLFAPLEDAVNAYNELVGEYNGILDDISGDDKSEKWQESERGQAYVAWRENIDACKLDGLKVCVDARPLIDLRPFKPVGQRH